MKETFTVYEKDLKGLAEKVLAILSDTITSQAKVILLEGDLGAGKTTFTKSLAEVLGIEKEDVHSPTFILKKEYKAAHGSFKKLIHIDAYRFTHPNEARVLALEEDLKDPQAIIIIEWPSKMETLAADVEIEFTVIGDETREVTLSYEKINV